MIKTNFHTHTLYCDGKNTPAEMVQKAIEKGFYALGFSGHSFIEQDKLTTMSLFSQLKYCDEIKRLADTYSTQISLFCGIEQDSLSALPKIKYDYVIGSVHALSKKGKYLPIDVSAHQTRAIIKDSYSRNKYNLIKEYYERVSQIVEITNCDVIGHFDLIRKFADELKIEEDDEYMEYAERAIDALVKCDKIFEVNTGAYARANKTEPYPSQKLLKILKDKGAKIMVNSDCHDADLLDAGFEKAEKLLIETGFKSRYELAQDGVKEIALV